MNVFLVTSPFQYICANEAREYFNTEANLLVLVEQDTPRGQKNMDHIFDQSKWDDIIRIPRTNRTFQVPKAINYIKNKNENIENLFLSEYHGWRSNVFIKNVPAEKIIYLDDGLATLIEYEEQIKPDIPYKRKRIFNDLVLKLQGITPPNYMQRQKNFEIFTIFELEETSVKIHRNRMSSLRSCLNSAACYEPSAPIGFIGEANVGVYKEGVQPVGYLSTIRNVLAESGRPMIYFPHRMEQDDIFKAVSRIPGVTIHNSESPIEREIGEKNIKLSHLYGYSSTALYTLSIIYCEIPIHILENENMAGSLSNSFNNYLIKQFKTNKKPSIKL